MQVLFIVYEIFRWFVCSSLVFFFCKMNGQIGMLYNIPMTFVSLSTLFSSLGLINSFTLPDFVLIETVNIERKLTIWTNFQN